MDAAGFRDRHRQPGAFVLPNAWDAGTAKLLAAAGFEALATTSAGAAFAAGVPDGRLGREAALASLAAIAAAVPVPVTADLEDGYADDAAGVGETVRAAIAAGAVGANIEDVVGDRRIDPATAAERLRAARRAADAETPAFTLNARIDTFLRGEPDPFEDVATRAPLYTQAGADCIFVPGVAAPDDIARVVGLTGGAPVNVVAGLSGDPLTLAEYGELGVRRVTIGGTLTRAAFGVVRTAAEQMLAGRFDFALGAPSYAELNRLMA